MCNNKRFVITVYPTSNPEDPITSLLSQYNKAFLKSDDNENLQKAQDEIENIIYETGWCKFAPLAPGIEKGASNSPISLYSAINPETFYFRLIIDKGNADIIQEYPLRLKYISFYLAINIISNLLRYSVQKIIFIKKLIGIGYIAEVSINKKDICCKMLVPTHSKAIQRKYKCLKKIAESKYAFSIKAPKLIDFVVDKSDNKGVIRILEEYVPYTMNLNRSQKDIKAVINNRRRKWATQIKDNIELLHKIGVM